MKLLYNNLKISRKANICVKRNSFAKIKFSLNITFLVTYGIQIIRLVTRNIAKITQFQTIRKSPDTPDKSGEICFGLVKYLNFFLINMFKFLQKYKNVW